MDRQYLKRKFLREAVVTDIKKGFIAAPFVNRERDPRSQLMAAKLIARHFRNVHPDKIVAIPMQGIPLASNVANFFKEAKEIIGFKEDVPRPYWSNSVVVKVESFTTEKEKTIIIPYVSAGDRVLLIDDVCATGNCSLSIIRKMRELGAEVVGFGVWVDKVFQGGSKKLLKEGVDFYSVLKVEKITPQGKIILSD